MSHRLSVEPFGIVAPVTIENTTLEKWVCGQDDRSVLPKAVLEKKESCFVSYESLEEAMELIKEDDGTRHLPLMQNVEAIAYGGQMDVVGDMFAIRTCKYKSLQELPIWDRKLLDTPEIKVLLQYVENHSQESIVLDVEGPFTILAGLMGMENILRAYRKERNLLLKVLDKITEELTLYVRDAVSKGVDVISLAEPQGDLALVGSKVYKELSGKYLVKCMRGIEETLKKAIVHVCGRTSTSLIKADLVLEKKFRVEEKEYLEILMELSKDCKTKFVGQGCMRQKHLVVPIITKLELV